MSPVAIVVVILVIAVIVLFVLQHKHASNAALHRGAPTTPVAKVPSEPPAQQQVGGAAGRPPVQVK